MRKQICQNSFIRIIKSVVVIGRNEPLLLEMNFLKVIFYEKDCLISKN